MNRTELSQEMKLDSNISWKYAIVFACVGICLIGLIIYFCCRNANNRSRSNSIDSFQQLYFTKACSTPSNTNIKQPTIERWSSIDQPTLTFYRVYIQDKPDEFYRPVTTERLHTSFEQSKAMEYVGHEIVFF